MKGILVILMVFGIIILAAVALALASNFGNTATPTLAPPPQGNLVATPTPAAAALPTVPPAGQPTALPPVGDGATDGATSPFNGSFAGTLSTGNGSSAPVNLALTQTGTIVSGDINIGDGLTIDGGNCGAQAIPAGGRAVSGQTDPSNPNHIEVSAGYDVQGITITARLTADLSADGNAITGRIDLDLPFFCGSDPVITGALARQ